MDHVSRSGPKASTLVKSTARTILRYLRAHPDGATKEDLCAHTSVSSPSMQRSLTWLRDVCDSPLEFDRRSGLWRLSDGHFSLPLSDPDPEDLSAVMFAAALLNPIADEEITHRVRRLAEQMDAEIRERVGNTASGNPRVGTMIATVTTASPTDPEVLTVLLASVGRSVVEIGYESPWSSPRKSHDNETTPRRRRHEIEPWQLRVHDGALYLRAWSRTHDEARSYRVAQIRSAHALEQLATKHTMPAPDRIWGDEDPAFGIDHDRPGIATLHVRGGVARWMHSLRWDPGQEDQWLQDGELLVRRLPYRSCRELARRLLSLGGAIESIEPPELRDEVLDHARQLVANMGGMDEEPGV